MIVVFRKVFGRTKGFRQHTERNINHMIVLSNYDEPSTTYRDSLNIRYGEKRMCTLTLPTPILALTATAACMWKELHPKLTT
jgi:hypothetical protein